MNPCSVWAYPAVFALIHIKYAIRRAVVRCGGHRHIKHMSGSSQTHWDKVYSGTPPEQASWRQARPEVSLELIGAIGLRRGAAVIDVGGGASTLVDHLLEQGFAPTVLDISHAALAQARTRLGPRAEQVRWVIADVAKCRPEAQFDLWHDRAALHFLIEPADQQAYAACLHAALKPGGHAIIAGFAPGAPERCSGLPVVQHDAASLAALLGPGFELVHARDETHRTPAGAEQAFRYHVFRRIA